MTTPEEIAVALARFEVKLDAALAKTDDHETRLRAVERRLWIAAGASGAVASGATHLLAAVF